MNAPDAEWRKKYEKHLKSARWKNTRRDLFRLRGELCEACGYPSPNLQVHHLSYDRLGCELPSDLKIVCKKCHEQEDAAREISVKNKREERRYSSAFDTWFQKKTGMDAFYANECDWDDFDRWLDRKRDEY
jgi:hypothetical protein